MPADTRVSAEMREMVGRLVAEASEQGYTAFAAPVTHDLARAKVEATRAALLSSISRLEADRERLDWLDAEHERTDPAMRLVAKLQYIRESGVWANCDESAREAIDTARAAEGER